MKPSNSCLELPKILKKLREKNRFSQHEIAEKLNISQSKYNYFESGKYYPDALSIKFLSELYNVTVSELLGDSTPTAYEVTTIDVKHNSHLIESNNKVHEKLISVYEKRISELEEKCLRKDNKIDSLLSKLELLSNTVSENRIR